MTAYVPIFTTGVVQPSNVAYRAVSIGANYAPVWPSLAANTPEVVANLMDVTATVGGLTITLPPANEVGTGTTVIWHNTGANSFTLVDQSNATILTLTSGQVFAVYLTDNSTAAGTWGNFQFSVTSSSVVPGQLAGLGLVAITTTLNQSHPIVATAVNGYTISASDRAELLNWTGGAAAVALPSAAVIGNNFFLMLRNSGSGILSVLPNGTDLIDGSASLTLNPTESCFLICSGAGWNTVGQGRSVTIATTQLIVPVGGNTDVTLTSTQAANQLLQFTGILTGNINVIVPTNVASYHCFNNTTGAFTLTVKTSGGTGILLPQGLHSILDCDGTNVVSADSVFTQASVIACTATGTNAIALTPVSGTAVLSYVDQTVFTFTPGNTSTGAVTVNVSGVGAGGLFLSDGTTQATTQMVQANQPLAIMRANALNGFILLNATAPTGSAVVFLQTKTAANSASLDLTVGFSSITDDVMIDLVDIIPVNDASELWARVSQGGVFQNGANNYTYARASIGGGAVGEVNASDTKYLLTTLVSNSAIRGLSGKVYIFAPSSTSTGKKIMWDLTMVGSDANFYTVRGGGTFNANTGAIDGFQILGSGGGNILSGRINSYLFRRS